MRVFITRSILNSGIEYLKQNGHEVEIFMGEGPIDQKSLYQGAKKSDALITMLNDQIDSAFLKENSHLKVIANYAVGINNIDITTAKNLNIRICNTPDVLTEATAEIALTLMLNVARNITTSREAIVNGQFISFNPKGYLGFGLKGKTLGVIGMGRIGGLLADKAHKAFDMKVIYHSRKNKFHPIYEYVDLNDLLSRSDVISIHTDLNESSKFLINADSFKLMKKNAILINTARGDVIDQEALIFALSENKIWGAGLDVTSPEPLPHNHPLLGLKNCFILPHIGSATFETREEMSLFSAKNIQAVFDGECPKGLVV